MTTHSAPGTSGGIYFQLERALFRLAEASADDLVGVETDDDVAVRRPDGSGISEQDKLSFQTSGHPFQDRSHGLWNTLLIWLDAAAHGTSFNKSAQLLLVTTRDVPRGALAARIGAENKTGEQINECIKILRAISSDPRQEMADLMQRVTAYDDEALAAVIRRVRLEDGSAGATQLRAQSASLLHLPPDVDGDQVVQTLLGWMQDTLMSLWRARKPGWIARAAFDRQLHAILTSLSRRQRRERAARLIAVSQADREESRARAFVERLLDIEIEGEDIDQAIEDFVRFSAERLRLSGEGDVVPDDWVNFFDEIEDRWRRILNRHRRNRTGETAEAIGRNIYSDTVEVDYLAPLGCEPTEHTYFTAGGYHTSADSGRVHWHPDGSTDLVGDMAQVSRIEDP
jgi:hypothetical protein